MLPPIAMVHAESNITNTTVGLCNSFTETCDGNKEFIANEFHFSSEDGKLNIEKQIEDYL